MLKLKNATLHYDHQVIFDNLSLTLPTGSTTCLLGPSGVGKTSLLKHIADLIPPSKNYFVTGKLQTLDDKPLTHRIAYMAQSDSLLPWLTVKQNALIGHTLRSTATKNQEKKVFNLLKTLGLADVIHAYPEKLSGGMRQRVALARVLMEDRDLILLDEPLSSLDAITRYQLQNLIATQLSNKTLLLVTHDPLEALRLGDFIYVMQGKPATLKKVLHLETKTPRDPKEQNLLKQQAELLNALSEESVLC